MTYDFLKRTHNATRHFNWKKKINKKTIWMRSTEFGVISSVLAPLASSVRTFDLCLRRHNHIPVTFLSESGPLWAPERCSCDGSFGRNSVISKQISFHAQSKENCMTIADIDIMTSSANYLVVIRWLSNRIFVTALMFSSVIDVRISLLTSQPSKKNLYHLHTFFLLNVDPQNATANVAGI